jgi:hypothetical protein
VAKRKSAAASVALINDFFLVELNGLEPSTS